MADTQVTESLNSGGDGHPTTDSHVPESHLDLPPAPDGGWGWIVVAGSLLFNLIADGCAYSFGVLYTELLDVFGDTKSNTSWVGSLFFGVPLLFGPVASAFVTMFGCRKMTIFGGLMTTSGFILSYFATSIEMLCVTFGVIAGIGLSFCYVTSMVIVAFYFEQKRALATGIAVSGAGIGTFIFAPLTEYLIETYGWRGTVLILGGILLNTVVSGALFRPLKFSKTERQRRGLEQLDKLSRDISGQTLNPKDRNPNKSKAISSIKAEYCFKMDHPDKKPTSLSQMHLPTSGNTDQLHKTKMDRTALLKHPTSAQTQSHESISSGQKKMASLKHWQTVLPMSKYVYYSCPDFRFGSVGLLSGSSVKVENAKEQHKMSKVTTQVQRLKQEIKTIFSTNVLRDRCFLVFVISNFILYFWYDIPYIFMTDRAQGLGVTEEKASLLISIIGVVNTFGQILYGYIGDRNINLTLLYSASFAIVGVIVLLIPLYHGYWYMCLLAGIYGFFISANTSLSSVMLVKFLGLDKLTNAWGFLLLVQGVANLIGPPVAGWIYDKTHSYDATFYSAGAWISVSGLMLIPLMCFKSTTDCQYSAVLDPPNSVTVHDKLLDSVDQKTERVENL